jgi:hypothetical protein
LQHLLLQHKPKEIPKTFLLLQPTTLKSTSQSGETAHALKLMSRSNTGKLIETKEAKPFKI